MRINTVTGLVFGVWMFLALPNQAQSIEDATSCFGYDCNIEGQVCPQGAPGANDGDYRCTSSKWVAFTAQDKTPDMDQCEAECRAAWEADVIRDRVTELWGIADGCANHFSLHRCRKGCAKEAK